MITAFLLTVAYTAVREADAVITPFKGPPRPSYTTTVDATEGFSQVSQRGSHVKLRDSAGKTVIVPLHRELARGTLRSILRQADLTVEAFLELL